jgi:hypothetical protein
MIPLGFGLSDFPLRRAVEPAGVDLPFPHELLEHAQQDLDHE